MKKVTITIVMGLTEDGYKQNKIQELKKEIESCQHDQNILKACKEDGLDTIKTTFDVVDMSPVTISYKTIVQHAKRIEKANLDKCGSSLSYSGMLRDAPIVCTHHNSDVVEVEANWKDKLNKHKK